MAQTIKVTTTVDGLKFQGRRVHYCPLSLRGTCSETVSLRRASGSSNARAPGDWPCHRTPADRYLLTGNSGHPGEY
jgi:hypothetical protein